jgi:23S rRNA (adenine2503-C2)-methyltransferase
LRQGLIGALLRCKPQKRTCMLEVVLLDHVNDSLQEADEMADFVGELLNQVPNAKIVVNLIPFNEIHGGGGTGGGAVGQELSSIPLYSYRKPTMERVLAFQERLTSRGIYARVRETRGDEESAACGQLATKKMKQQQLQ